MFLLGFLPGSEGGASQMCDFRLARVRASFEESAREKRETGEVSGARIAVIHVFCEFVYADLCAEIAEA